MATAKVFWSGNSQAIRLPKDFRFPPGTEEVAIHREGERIVLEAVKVEEWPESFWRAFDGMPEDFERPLKQPSPRSLPVLAHSARLHSILEAARQQIRQGEGISHEDFWREVDEKERA